MAHSSEASLFGSQFGSSGISVKMKRARRPLEGGPVSEERYLQMQAEVYRLRKEATLKEETHKLLIARLCRAEDAAKRKMRDNFQQFLDPCKRTTNLIAAVSHQFYADQRIQELEDKLRERQRETEKIDEHNKQYKAEIQSLNRRLDVMMRYTRRVRPFVNPHDLPRRPEAKVVKDLRKEVMRLQEENLNLQFQISSLAQPAGNLQPQAQIVDLGSSEVPAKPPRSCNAHRVSPGPFPFNDFQQRVYDIKHQAHGSLFSEVEVGECVLKQSLDSAQGPSAQFVTSQMVETWERLESLKNRYDKSMEELQSFKINHEKTLHKLQESYRLLNEERRKTMRLEVAEQRLTAELSAAKQTEALLQQARQHNLQLESENAELVSSALTMHGRTKASKAEDTSPPNLVTAKSSKAEDRSLLSPSLGAPGDQKDPGN